MAHGTESTRHQQPGNKCLSIPFQNLMKTSIFIKSKHQGSTVVRFTELLQKTGETMTLSSPNKWREQKREGNLKLKDLRDLSTKCSV